MLNVEEIQKKGPETEENQRQHSESTEILILVHSGGGCGVSAWVTTCDSQGLSVQRTRRTKSTSIQGPEGP